ncbi:MAG: hypothetical protein LBH43_18110 [Treponema sp.]|jgi:hypothetical protein|nr:hypothetical protein [Treponema sp.]
MKKNEFEVIVEETVNGPDFKDITPQPKFLEFKPLKKLAKVKRAKTA